MGTSYSSLKTSLLRRIRDPNQQKWTSNDEIYELISQAERWLARFLGNIRGSGRFTIQETISLSANTEASNISALTSAATKAFVAVRYMDILSDGSTRQPMQRIPEGDENLWRNSAVMSGHAIPGYFIRNDQFIFLPTSGEARTIYCTYQWVPIAKTTSGDTAETPAEYDDLLLARVQFNALAREGEAEKKFEEEYAARLAEIEDYENSRTERGVTESVKNVSGRLLFGQ